MSIYAQHHPFTAPGRHAAAVGALPGEVGALMGAVQGLLVHCDWLEQYGLAAVHPARETLSVERRLDWLLEADGRPLGEARPAERRAVGTCRDYALMTCALLRSHQTPARVRCGFARYFAPGRLEDHWICEHRRPGEARWARADAQLDVLHREHLAIAFDPGDMPAGEFVTADEAWRLVRVGQAPADLFGHGEDAGAWFMRVNLARDYLALRGQMTSPWDAWRDVPAESRHLSAADAAKCDTIAACIAAVDDERGVADLPFALVPFWLS